MDNKKFSQKRWIKIVIILLCVIIAIIFLMPTLTRTTICTNNSACKSNIRQIMMAMKLYAGEHNDAYPTHLGQLYSNYTDEPAIFDCPAREKKVNCEIKDGKLINCDYVLIPGVKDTDKSTTIVIYDKYFQKYGGKIIANIGTIGASVNSTPDTSGKYKPGDLVPEEFIKQIK